MNIAVFGTGIVGRTLAEAIAAKGHTVRIGTRNPAETLARTEPDMMGTPPFSVWHGEHPGIDLVPFSEAALNSEVTIWATNGTGTVASVEGLDPSASDNKIVIDVSNALDFSQGMPPFLFVSNTDSLGEMVQRAVPNARVVKTLNTVNAGVMVNPRALTSDHNVFVSGNDGTAKEAVATYLADWFGWKPSEVFDLGDITTARGPEMYFALWIRVFLSNPAAHMYNIAIVR